MDHTGGCSCRHLDFGIVGVSALEGEWRDVTCSKCLMEQNKTEDDNV